MTTISVTLPKNTLAVLSALAQQHEVTLAEMTQYLIAKGLAQYGNQAANPTAFAGKITPAQQIEL